MIMKDPIPVIHPCAAGLDVHKMQIAAAVRTARETRQRTSAHGSAAPFRGQADRALGLAANVA